jgi:hypothetical protein
MMQTSHYLMLIATITFIAACGQWNTEETPKQVKSCQASVKSKPSTTKIPKIGDLPDCEGDSDELMYVVSADLYLRCDEGIWTVSKKDNTHRDLMSQIQSKSDAKDTATCLLD